MPASPEAIERLRRKVDSAPVFQPEAARGNGADIPVGTRRLDFYSAAAIGTADETFDDEIVEGVIGEASMAVIYGDSNSGKTFLALDIAAAVERGAQWLGRRTKPGLVLYLATESPGSVRMRLKAYKRRHGVDLAGVVIVRSPVNLFDGAADVTAVAELVRDLERRERRRVVLIIGDTLARISAGANENSGEDMGVVLRNADAIRAATGAAFLWIHHTGKDQARGMRGWSGMRAAIDTEVEVTHDEATGIRTAEITKQRDLPGKGERFGFTLEPVPVGVNRWGSERTSCVVVSTDAPPKTTRGKRPSEIAGAIVEFLTARGTGCRKGAMVKHFEGRYTSSAVYREMKHMVSDGRLIEAAGIVALPGKPGSANY
jgi:RecA/RadA recombinase